MAETSLCSDSCPCSHSLQAGAAHAPVCPLNQGPDPRVWDSWGWPTGLLHGGIRLQAQSIPVPPTGSFFPTLLSTEFLLLQQCWDDGALCHLCALGHPCATPVPWVTPVLWVTPEPWVPSSPTADVPTLRPCAGEAGWPFPRLATWTLGPSISQQRSAAGCWLLGSHRLRNVNF